MWILGLKGLSCAIDSSGEFYMFECNRVKYITWVYLIIQV